jgi:hypothetical protein
MDDTTGCAEGRQQLARQNPLDDIRGNTAVKPLPPFPRGNQTACTRNEVMQFHRAPSVIRHPLIGTT